MTLKIKLYGEVHEFNPEEDTAIDSGNLEDSLIELPEQMVRYIIASAALDRAEDEAKLFLQQTYAHIDHTERNIALSAGIKTTEKMIENIVITRPDYRTAFDAYQQAKEDAKIINQIVRVLFAKKDIIDSLIKIKNKSDFGRANDTEDYESQILAARNKYRKESIDKRDKGDK